MIVNTKDDEVSYATWKQINMNSDIEYILSFLPDREKRLIKDILDGYTFGEVSKKYKLNSSAQFSSPVKIYLIVHHIL